MRTLAVVLRLFRTTLVVQRRRMVMTVAAIAWGTISIVLLLSFGEGLKRALMKGAHGTGDGIVIVWPGETETAFAGFPAGRDIALYPEDVALVRDSVPEIGAISGEMTRWAIQLAVGDTVINKKVTGVEPEFGAIRAHVPEPGGRFLDPLDQELKRRVVFLGTEVARELFGDDDPVGRTVRLHGSPFTVVGVMREKIQMNMYGGPDAEHAVIPLSTAEALFGRRRLSNIVYRAVDHSLQETAKTRFAETLAAKYRFAPEDSRALSTWDTYETQSQMRAVFVGIQLFLGIIGGLTLVIAGVGVANIMYAVVTQRSREIGVQMALGARRAYVMGPLVLEALALTALGGGIGVAVGWTLVTVLATIQRSVDAEVLQFLGSPTFSFPVALTTVALLGTVGLAAGWFPSRRAASVQPAVVLREE